MALTKDELIEVMNKFKELGLTSFEADGIKITNSTPAPAPSAQSYEPPKASPIPEDVQAADIVTPISVFDELTEDEILYWSSSYFDELQAKKTAMAQARKDE